MELTFPSVLRYKSKVLRILFVMMMLLIQALPIGVRPHLQLEPQSRKIMDIGTGELISTQGEKVHLAHRLNYEFGVSMLNPA